MGEMGKGEMGTAHAGKPPSLPRELRTPLVAICDCNGILGKPTESQQNEGSSEKKVAVTSNCSYCGCFVSAARSTRHMSAE
jgi:hypothetical protein